MLLIEMKNKNFKSKSIWFASLCFIFPLCNLLLIGVTGSLLRSENIPLFLLDALTIWVGIDWLKEMW